MDASHETFTDVVIIACPSCATNCCSGWLIMRTHISSSESLSGNNRVSGPCCLTRFSRFFWNPSFTSKLLSIHLNDGAMME